MKRRYAAVPAGRAFLYAARALLLSRAPGEGWINREKEWETAIMNSEMTCAAVVDAERPDPAVITPVNAVGLKRRQISFDAEKIAREKPVYRFLKRGQDIVISVLAIAALATPMLILALIIYLDSPGAPPIFKQKRIGLDGRAFRLYKFRTMVPNAEEHLGEVAAGNEMDGPVFKIRDDPRITRVGSVLRRSGCDELPQLFNVIRGDMSLVGPRPPLPGEVEQYSAYDRQRLYVKPGLSCYWQIQPKRNSLSFREWMELDMKYIRERSLLTDWKIMIKTVKVMFMREGC